jgi:hypothetical protein
MTTKTKMAAESAGQKRVRRQKAVDNSMRFSNSDVSLDEAIARNGGLVIPGKPGIIFDLSW